MKKLQYLAFAILFGTVVLSGCTKDPDLRMPELKLAVVPNLALAEGSDDIIDFFDPESFSGGIVVDLYWKTDVPKSMDLIVVFNNDKANPGLIQANITQFPSTVSFSLQNLLDALPQIDNANQLVTADKFNFYVNITLEDGSVLLGADTLYDAFSSDVDNYPGVQTKIQYGFFCPFDINNFVGAYDCDEAGYGIYSVNMTADPVVPNRVLNDNFWDWAAPGSVVFYDFSADASQTVNVPLQDFTFGDGVVGSVEGSGTYDACLGIMTVNYIVVYGGSEYPTTHVFTPATGKALKLGTKAKMCKK